MGLLDTPGFFAATTTAALLGAASWVWPGPGGSNGAIEPVLRPAFQGAELACRVEAAPGGVRKVRLSLAHGPALARGTRIAWSTLGTPRPSGELLSLPHEFKPGDTLLLDTALVPHAAGCRAQAWAESGT